MKSFSPLNCNYCHNKAIGIKYKFKTVNGGITLNID